VETRGRAGSCRSGKSNGSLETWAGYFCGCALDGADHARMVGDAAAAISVGAGARQEYDFDIWSRNSMKAGLSMNDHRWIVV